MVKLFDINEKMFDYFGQTKLKTTIILNFQQSDVIVFDENTPISCIPNTIEALCELSSDFSTWYSNAVENNKKYSRDYYLSGHYMIKKFYVDLIIDTTPLDIKNNHNPTFSSKIKYQNKIYPYHQ